LIGPYRNTPLAVHFDIMPMTTITEAEAQAGLSSMTDALESQLIINATPPQPGELRGQR
jgi:hypothetical protein